MAAFSSDTEEMRAVAGEIGTPKSQLEDTITDLTNYVEETFNTRCQGFLADKFRNEVYKPAHDELNNQVNKVQEVQTFISASSSTIDDAAQAAASKFNG